MPNIEILLPKLQTNSFAYSLPQNIQANKGDFVQVTFRKQEFVGIVWQEYSEYLDQEKIKPVLKRYDLPPLKKELMEFVDWVAEYTMNAPGSILKMVIPIQSVFKEKSLSKFIPIEPASIVPASSINLSEEQQVAVNKLKEPLDNKDHKVLVLEGVTGSGKTEVYFELIEQVLKEKSGQVLILLPEISLTSQLIQRITKRFGIEPARWHSDLTDKEKRNTWLNIAYGGARLIVGARSALFLPYSDLRLIIIDEEHDSSFKQEEGVTYQARDMAVVRAYIEKIPIILSSATPSLETIYNVNKKKYELVTLASRFGEATLPTSVIVDMKGDNARKKKFISAELVDELKDVLEQGKQAILFLNRRGYAPLTLCGECGYRFACPNCSTWLVEHRSLSCHQCHQCGYSVNFKSKCPTCHKENSFVPCGPGVERIEEEVKYTFPDARTILMTRDTVNSIQAVENIINQILDGKVDIIIGTQMIAKGHHFPKITLVGIIDADLGLLGGDLRAAERTYQLLSQVSGRAGREKDKGKVVIQTFNPENPIIQSLVTGERRSFLEQEIMGRKMVHMPPFGKLASIVISGFNDEKVAEFARFLVKISPVSNTISVLGPVPALISRIKNKFRYRILVKAERNISIQKYINYWLDGVKAPGSIKLKVDIDPYNFF
jgi:primosomal protein N' (replication factor Y)